MLILHIHKVVATAAVGNPRFRPFLEAWLHQALVEEEGSTKGKVEPVVSLAIHTGDQVTSILLKPDEWKEVNKHLTKQLTAAQISQKEEKNVAL